MAAGTSPSETGVSIVVSASTNIIRGAAALPSCITALTTKVNTEQFKMWAEHLLRSRGDGVASRDPINSQYLEGDAVAMGYFGQSPMYERFAGPWTTAPLQMHDVDWEPPPEYRINSAIKDKLAPVDFRLYGDDVLFYTFYAFVSESLQIMAAHELYIRGWRFHIQRRLWLRQTSRSWAIFEPWSWQVVERDLDVDLTLLEGRPQPPKPYVPRNIIEEQQELACDKAASGPSRPSVSWVPLLQQCRQQQLNQQQSVSRYLGHEQQQSQNECLQEEEQCQQKEQNSERQQHNHHHNQRGHQQLQQELQQQRQHELQQQLRRQHDLQHQQRWQQEIHQQHRQHEHHHQRQQQQRDFQQQQQPHQQSQQQQNLHYHQTLQLQQHNTDEQQQVLQSNYNYSQAVQQQQTQQQQQQQLNVQYHQFGGNIVIGLPSSLQHTTQMADDVLEGQMSVAAAAVTVMQADCRVTI